MTHGKSSKHGSKDADPPSTSDHLEAMLLWSDAGPDRSADGWLAERGLTVMPMRQGLLATGDRATFEKAFDVDLEGRALPIALPVPHALRDAVAAISIRRPPAYQKGGW